MVDYQPLAIGEQLAFEDGFDNELYAKFECLDCYCKFEQTLEISVKRVNSVCEAGTDNGHDKAIIDRYNKVATNFDDSGLLIELYRYFDDQDFVGFTEHLEEAIAQDKINRETIIDRMWDYVEKNLPDYDSNIDVTLVNDLSVIIDGEITEGSYAEKLADERAFEFCGLLYDELDNGSRTTLLNKLRAEVEELEASLYAKALAAVNRSLPIVVAPVDIDREVYDIILIHTARTWERIRLHQPHEEMPIDNIGSTDVICQIADEIYNNPVIQLFVNGNEETKRDDFWIKNTEQGMSDWFIEAQAELIINKHYLN
jgi:hypothetical protein